MKKTERVPSTEHITKVTAQTCDWCGAENKHLDKFHHHTNKDWHQEEPVEGGVKMSSISVACYESDSEGCYGEDLPKVKQEWVELCPSCWEKMIKLLREQGCHIQIRERS